VGWSISSARLSEGICNFERACCFQFVCMRGLEANQHFHCEELASLAGVGSDLYALLYVVFSLNNYLGYQNFQHSADISYL
jgi:hypothetical protein